MPKNDSQLCNAGIHEFVFGGELVREAEYLEFWAKLGFVPVLEGELKASQAQSFYGHHSALRSIRLQHLGCNSHQTGYVRLQLWTELRNEGLGNGRAIECGSRWMGMYTHDVLQLHDSFTSAASKQRWNLKVTPVINAPLQNPPPAVDFDQPFVGLRELLVFGNDFRLAFIQRAGFDRPGFGTFDDSLPYKNTEGSHANVVQPANSFSTEFYKTVFGLDTAPYGDAHDSGDEPPTIAALGLKQGEIFHVERIKQPNCPSGLIQVYSSYVEGADNRDLSRPGSRNLCAYSVQVSDINELSRRVSVQGGVINNTSKFDEFGQAALCFCAPDGYSWLATTMQKEEFDE